MRIGEVGILGKIPARGDFIRLNASGAAAEGLFDWLQICLERQKRDRIEQGPLLATFLLPVESASEMLLGVLVDSQDKVGRVFPLVAFQSYPFATCVGRLAALLQVSLGRIEMMKSLLAERDKLEPAGLADRAAQLSNEPTPELDASAVEYQSWFDSVSAGVSSELGFMGLGPESARTALLTFLQTCRPFAGGKPPRTPVTLGCPVASAEDAPFWIELAERVLSWPHAAPGILISHTGQPRLLLTLGPLPDFAFGWIRNPGAYPSRVLALAEAASSMSSDASDLEQKGTLTQFFASLRSPGTP